MNVLYKKTTMILVATMLITPFVGAQEEIIDECMKAVQPCIEAVSPIVKDVRSSYWNSFVSGMQGVCTSVKDSIQKIDTTSIQESIKGFGTSCMQAVKKDPKKTGIYTAVGLISCYVIYKLLKKPSKKNR